MNDDRITASGAVIWAGSTRAVSHEWGGGPVLGDDVPNVSGLENLIVVH
jgi:hypothetical protein